MKLFLQVAAVWSFCTYLIVQSSDFLSTEFREIPRYASIEDYDNLRIAADVILILDCHQFSHRSLSLNINESSVRWFFRPDLETPPLEIEGNETRRKVFLGQNPLQIIINRTALDSGADDGTDGDYTCEACSYSFRPNFRCVRKTTRVRIFAPPQIETNCSNIPSIEDFIPTTFLTSGCNICLEKGQSIGSLLISCIPTGLTRQPVTCNFQIGRELVPTIEGRQEVAFGMLSLVDVRNPPESPEFDFLKTYICNCTNSDGSTLATTSIMECFLAPLIRKGVPRFPIRSSSIVPFGSIQVVIGSNNTVRLGNSVNILCDILQSDPLPAIQWLKNDEVISGENTTALTVQVTNETLAEGNYTCVASNIAGRDSASTLLRSGIEIVQSPDVLRGPFQKQPSVYLPGNMTAQVGTDVYVILGKSVTLLCDLAQRGIPQPTYEWRKNNFPINSTLPDLLVLENLTEVRVDHYCCSATNVVGSSFECSTVNSLESGPILTLGPLLPYPDIRRPEALLSSQETQIRIGGNLWTAEGSRGKIHCDVSFANPPLLSIDWLYGDPPMLILLNETSVGNNSFLERITISTNVLRKTSTLEVFPTVYGDDTTFTCRAISEAKTTTATTQFGVLRGPIIVQGNPTPVPMEIPLMTASATVGETLHVAANQTGILTCKLQNDTGLPDGSVRFLWSYGKFMVPINDGDFDGRYRITSTNRSSTLEIGNTMISDSRDVFCVAENPVSYQRVGSRVNVYEVPTIQRGNRSIIVGPEAINGKSLQGNIGSTFLITLGDRLFIDCNLENGGGFPSQPEEGLPANITWLRNGEPFNQTLLDNVHSSQLCFDALSLSFGGTIECIATSRLSSDGSFLVDRATSEVTILMCPEIQADPDGLVDRPGERVIPVVPSSQNVYYISSNTTAISLVCSALGVPPANFTWTRTTFEEGTAEVVSSDRITIIQGDSFSELKIDDFQPEDVGKYQCMVVNIACERSANIELKMCPEIANITTVPNTTFVISLKPSDPYTRDTCPTPLYYEVGDYGPCEPLCHKGTRHRSVRCLSVITRDTVDLATCSATVPAPPTSGSCSLVLRDRPCAPLEPRWYTTRWSPCTRTCDGGFQTRNVLCFIQFSNTQVLDSKCAHRRKPIKYRTCNDGISCFCEDSHSICGRITPDMCTDYIPTLCCYTCFLFSTG